MKLATGGDRLFRNQEESKHIFVRSNYCIPAVKCLHELEKAPQMHLSTGDTLPTAEQQDPLPPPLQFLA